MIVYHEPLLLFRLILPVDVDQASGVHQGVVGRKPVVKVVTNRARKVDITALQNVGCSINRNSR